MTKYLTAVLTVLFALALTPVPALAGDPVVQYSTEDREMNAAIEQARGSLPHFFEQLSDQDVPIESYALKVAVPTTTRPGAEHIWMMSFRPEGDELIGIVGNEPNDVEGMRRGDEYRFSLSAVSDWNYWSGGKLHGAYTIRVMLPRLPADQQTELRQVLAPLP